MIHYYLSFGSRLLIKILFFIFVGFGPSLGTETYKNNEEIASRLSVHHEHSLLPMSLYGIPQFYKASANSMAQYVKAVIVYVRANKAFKILGAEKLKLLTKSPQLCTIFSGSVKPLTTDEDLPLNETLYKHITVLSYDIGPRNFHKFPANLEKSKEYILRSLGTLEGYQITEQRYGGSFQDIKTCLQNNGCIYKPTSSGLSLFYKRRNMFAFQNVSERYEFTNIIAEKKGTNSNNRILTVVAHYDTASDSPGADDNASGVAAGLALAEMFSSLETESTLRFLFVPNGELPLSRTEYMGSLHYFNSLRAQEKLQMDVIALGALGYYSEEAKSQNLILPILSKQYPDRKGNFVSLIGKVKDKRTYEPEPLLIKSTTYFSEANLIRSELLNAPIDVYGYGDKGCEDDIKNILYGDVKALLLRQAGHSDHWSAWKEDINSAIMISDTTFLRNKHDHTESDTYETINYTYLTRTVQSIFHMMKMLANEHQENS